MTKKEQPASEPKQITPKGLEIPVPKRKDVFDLLNRAAKKRPKKASPPEPRNS